VLTDSAVPTIDPATGRFSKPFPPANGWEALVPVIAQEVLGTSGTVTLRLDSLHLGSAADGIPVEYFVRASTPELSTTLVLPLLQSQTNQAAAASLGFAFPVDRALAARFGGSGPYALPVTVTAELPGNYYTRL
jgi:hypothetical protein